MEILFEYDKVPRCALALGDFDGLHIAHKKIIKKCVEYAKDNHIKCGILLFSNNSKKFIDNRELYLLTTYEEKLEILKKLGIDFVLVQDFNEEFMNISYSDFFGMLISKNAKALFCGFDYHFGKNREGDVLKLSKLSKDNNIFLDVTEEIEIEGNSCKSSKIRELLKNGEVAFASKFLGTPFSMTSKVIHGFENGRKMGFPTANLEVSSEKLIPKDGVYLGNALINEKKYKCLINIGKNPTFDAKNRTVEAYIDGFFGNLYSQKITVEFFEKIRDEKKFNSCEELTEQIKRDLKRLTGEQ